MLSVILPSFNEEKSIENTAKTISRLLNEADIEHEIIFVDDGSSDQTWEKIKSVSEESANIRGVSFSRNFGKEAAITAGLEAAKGQCCAVLDCDLQHPPQALVDMYRLWEDGYEVVEGIKSDRGKESGFHHLAADGFYSLISKMIGFDMSNASDYKLLDRRAVDVILKMREKKQFFRAMSFWVGFKTATVEYDVQERFAGESKWSAKALLKYAINNIASFSELPLQIVTVVGVIMMAGVLITAVVAGIRAIMGFVPSQFFWLGLILLFSSSVIMIGLGVVGYYIARVFEEVKDRPRYIVARTCGLD